MKLLQKQRPRLTKQEQQELIDLYKTGLYSTTTLAKRFNFRKYQSVWKILNKNGIKTVITKDDQRWKFKYDDKFIDEIISYYETNKCSLVDLTKQFNIPHSTLRLLFNRRGSRIRSQSEVQRKYCTNEDFFDNINNETSSYILGFLYTDGCNFPEQSHIILDLQEKDKEILEKIRDLLSPDRPLYYSDNSKKKGKLGLNIQNSYRLQIANKHMSQRLVELGVTKAKTHVLTFPEWLDKSLYRHFIRGVLDGDGCISIDRKRGPRINITSTSYFCLRLKEIIKENLDINSYFNRSNHYGTFGKRAENINSIEISGGIQVRHFLNWIYEDSTLYLKRKHDLYLTIKERHINRNKKDLSNISCLLCNSITTHIEKNGYHKWYNYKDGFLCSKCYFREHRKNKRKELLLNTQINLSCRHKSLISVTINKKVPESHSGLLRPPPKRLTVQVSWVRIPPPAFSPLN